MFLQCLTNRLSQIAVSELGREQVQCHALHIQALHSPDRHLSARFIYDPLADLMSNEMCFEGVQKVRREEQPAFRVLPTQQRFHTDQFLIGQPDLRLIR